MLEDWLEAAVEAAGAEDVDPSLLSDATVTVVLDLARDAAHSVERPAAPLAAFAAGLALGRSGGGQTELTEIARGISERAAAWSGESA